MIQATCIQKFRDKRGVIVGYRLQDSNGAVNDVNSLQLKQAIRDGRVSITNLRLTSDGRLVDCGAKEGTAEPDTDLNLMNLILKHVLKHLNTQYKIRDYDKLRSLWNDSPDEYDRYFELDDIGHYLGITIRKDCIWVSLCDNGMDSIKEWKIQRTPNTMDQINKNMPAIKEYIKSYIENDR